MDEIRLYIEGGSSNKAQTKASLRQGFSVFFRSIIAQARAKKLKWTIIVSGSTTETIKGFLNAVRYYPNAQSFVLIDADGPVNKEPSFFMADKVRGYYPHQYRQTSHLMVQVMESWFLADSESLIRYYGQNFNRGSLPGASDIERVSKSDVFTALRKATSKTQKGSYHKIQHASELLKIINPEIVSRKATHCRSLFIALEDTIARAFRS